MRINWRVIRLRFLPHLDTEGFISAGIIGLFEAIEKYNPDEKTRFLGYVSIRVGEPSWKSSANWTSPLVDYAN